jgi:hypothetical protein
VRSKAGRLTNPLAFGADQSAEHGSNDQPQADATEFGKVPGAKSAKIHPTALALIE